MQSCTNRFFFFLKDLESAMVTVTRHLQQKKVHSACSDFSQRLVTFEHNNAKQHTQILKMLLKLKSL